MGKEKRCVNCMNRFRLVRTDEELIVQYQVHERKGSREIDADKSERSLHGNLTGVGGGSVLETRYSILEADAQSSELDGGGAGVFAEFLQISENQPPGAASESSEPDADVPIEQSLKIDEVFGDLTREAMGAEAARPPRILTSKDLLERQERGFRREFRLRQPPSARRGGASGDLADTVRNLVSNLTTLDLVLVAAFVVVGLGALLGFTSAGFFGMNWLSGEDPRPSAAKKPKAHARFTKDEVYNLINLAPEKKDARPTPLFNKDGSVLPEGDYANLFVEDVEIAIRSVPSGATVYRGEQALGATPLLVRMGKTENLVVLRLEKEGFEPETLRFVGVESRAFDLPLRVPGSSIVRTPRAPGPSKPPPPKEAKEKKPGDDFIIY
jgi:hypothetical protein